MCKIHRLKSESIDIKELRAEKIQRYFIIGFGIYLAFVFVQAIYYYFKVKGV